MVEFIGDAISGNTFLCAHNANFDSGFLTKALERNGYDATLFFIDTLCLSRKAFYFDNYKQETIANHFGIINSDSHRAVNDAETCRLIMVNLCDLIIEILQREEANEARAKEIAQLTDEQKEWCAYIQDRLIKNGFDTEFLAFRGQSSNYVSCECIYNFLKIKFGKNKKYIIAKKVNLENQIIQQSLVHPQRVEKNIYVLFLTNLLRWNHLLLIYVMNIKENVLA